MSGMILEDGMVIDSGIALAAAVAFGSWQESFAAGFFMWIIVFIWRQQRPYGA